jgi:trans-aconitate methyltransferase
MTTPASPRVSMSDSAAHDPPASPNRPNPARMYDYMLGGGDHDAVDRAAVERIRAVMPEVSAAAWANRGFHQRAAKWMAQQGIAQFVDIGCGLPAMRNTHEVVQAVNPDTVVAYVDHDPVVIAHARELLADDGQTSILLADIRDPESVLATINLDGLIDLTKPTGLLCTAVLHFVADEDDPIGCIAGLVDALTPGSFLALSHITPDQMPPATIAIGIAAYRNATEQMHPRTRREVECFFTGLEMIRPYEGAPAELCRIGLWGCEDPIEADDDSSQPWWAGVGHKP